MTTYSGIGLMSGTSLDGIDLVAVDFQQEKNTWLYTITASEFYPYDSVWYTRLKNLHTQNAETFAKTNIYYGHYLGKVIKRFIEEFQLNPQFVASHGQTIFHNPNKGYTVQIGCGASIAKECGTPVVCDLRTSDMAYGGQGAPIVPLGERDLFPEIHQFVNIGGITNVSIHSKDTTKIIGYDVCGGNVLLNHLANQIDLPYDDGGKIASSGQVQDELLQKFNQLPYFQLNFPKTLDATTILNEMMPLLLATNYSVEDSLATIVEHIAIQLGQVLEPQKTLITGGGALNHYLIDRIQANTKATIVLPEKTIIDYKEALIMAFLGLKRLRKEANALASVTGATKDSINGAVYLP